MVVWDEVQNCIAQQMPLPLTISCSSKSRLVLTFLVYLSGTCSPGWSRTYFRRAVKRLCVCVCVKYINDRSNIIKTSACQLTLGIPGKSDSRSGNFSRNLATYVMMDLSSGLSTSTSAHSAMYTSHSLSHHTRMHSKLWPHKCILFPSNQRFGRVSKREPLR